MWYQDNQLQGLGQSSWQYSPMALHSNQKMRHQKRNYAKSPITKRTVAKVKSRKSNSRTVANSVPQSNQMIKITKFNKVI